MKKLGTPIGAGPGTANEKDGFCGVGVPSGLRPAARRLARSPARPSTWVAPSWVEGAATPGLRGRLTVLGWRWGAPPPEGCGCWVVWVGVDWVGLLWVGVLWLGGWLCGWDRVGVETLTGGRGGGET